MSWSSHWQIIFFQVIPDAVFLFLRLNRWNSTYYPPSIQCRVKRCIPNGFNVLLTYATGLKASSVLLVLRLECSLVASSKRTPILTMFFCNGLRAALLIKTNPLTTEVIKKNTTTAGRRSNRIPCDDCTHLTGL